MGWMTTLLASGAARKALGFLLAAFTISLFLVNLRRAGEHTGRLAERLSTSEKTRDVQRQVLDAASSRPADRDALAYLFGEKKAAMRCGRSKRSLWRRTEPAHLGKKHQHDLILRIVRI